MKMEFSNLLCIVFVVLNFLKEIELKDDIYGNCGRNALLDHLDFESIAPGQGETKPGDFPWIVSYGYFDSNKRWTHKCGGTIISSQLVLTAYHCFRDLNYLNYEERFEIMAGEVDFNTQPDEKNKVQIRKVQCGFQHPSKTLKEESLYFDIAILYLETPLTFTKYVRPMCVAKKETSVYYGKLSRILGWGSGAISLQQASVQIFSESFCNTTYQNSKNFDRTAGEKAKRALPGLFNSTVFCAGDETSASGACQGDSGGPLLVFEEADGINSHYEQVGIISGQIRCTKFPDIYVNLADDSLRNFVTQTMEAVQQTDILNSRDGLCLISGDSALQAFEDGLYKGKVVNGKRDGHGTMFFKDGTIYVGEWKNDKQSGKGKQNFSDGYYEGEFENSKLNGHGIFFYNDGYTYEGEWQDDEPFGYGKREEANVSTYEGQFKYGYAEGNGTYNASDGETYTGHWHQDQRSGVGSAHFPDGLYYVGEWANNYMHGNGTMYYPDGSIYKGEWQNGDKHGSGFTNWTDGSFYEGEYVNGEQEGQGIFHFSDGKKYKGSFKNGDFNGQGTIFYTNGAVYIGEFKDGLKHGKGKENYTDGSLYEGEYVNGEQNGQGNVHFANDRIYKGSFKNNHFNGQGTIYYTDGAQYTGEWRDSLKHGRGKENFTDGSYYEGEYVDGKQDGKGTYYFSDGTRYVGSFQNDEIVGQGTFYYTNGYVYIGEFKNDKKHGMGKENYTDGFFVGQYMNGNREGTGTFYHNDGNVFKGQWKNDQYVG